MTDLTTRQSEVLEFVARRIDDGLPPTLREIATALGVTSTNGVNDHIEALIRKEYLRRLHYTSRGLFVTAKGRAAIAESGKAPL